MYKNFQNYLLALTGAQSARSIYNKTKQNKNSSNSNQQLEAKIKFLSTILQELQKRVQI